VISRAQVNGVELAYELSGEGGETVAFLNGIAMSIGHWKPMASALGHGRRTLAHDFRGQLLSGKPAGPYTLELHARDLAALLDRLGIEAVHVVGTSYGSEVGLAFARLFPERTKSLAVIDGVSEIHPLLAAAVSSWRTASLVDPVAFFRALVPWTYSEAYIGANAAVLSAREKAVAGLPHDYFVAFADLCDAFMAIDETPHLGEIRCPTLIAVGEKDILKPEAYARIMAQGIRGARLAVLPGLGHASTIEDPEAVNALLEGFLESL
jgi:3-oxoadipate enol-lactonase